MRAREEARAGNARTSIVFIVLVVFAIAAVVAFNRNDVPERLAMGDQREPTVDFTLVDAGVIDARDPVPVAPDPFASRRPVGERGTYPILCVDESGNPISGVRLFLHKGSNAPRLNSRWFEKARVNSLIPSAVSDNAGMATFTKLNGRLWDIVPDRDPARPCFTPVDSSPDSLTTLGWTSRNYPTLVLQHAAVLRGSVSTAAGAPGVDVTVRVIRKDPKHVRGPYHLWDQPTGPNGEFAVVLQPGDHELRLFVDKDGPLHGLPTPPMLAITVQPGESAMQDWVLGRGECYFTGRMVNQDGEPWTKGVLRVHEHDLAKGKRSSVLIATDVNENGRFRVGPFVEGHYSLMFNTSTFASTGEGGLAEFPAYIDVHADAPGDIDVRENLAYKYDAVTTVVTFDTFGEFPPHEMAVRLDLPGSSRTPDKRSEFFIDIEKDGTYELTYSRHLPGIIRFKVKYKDIDLVHSMDIGGESGDPDAVYFAVE